MHVLVSYDVSTKTAAGKRRLRRIAQACLDYGKRVQFSVFECSLSHADWTRLRHRLAREIEPLEDSLRVYFLCDRDADRVEHVGVREPADLEGPLIL